MDKIDRWSRNVQMAAAAAAGIATVALAIMLTVGGLGRSLFSRPLQGDYEIVELILPWIIFLSFGYALLAEAHIRVTLLFERFPVRARLAIDIIVGVIGILVCVLLFRGGYLFTSDAVVQHLYAWPGLLQLPSWIAWLSVPIGSVLMALEYIRRLAKDIALFRHAIRGTNS